MLLKVLCNRKCSSLVGCKYAAVHLWQSQHLFLIPFLLLYFCLFVSNFFNLRLLSAFNVELQVDTNYHKDKSCKVAVEWYGQNHITGGKHKTQPGWGTEKENVSVATSQKAGKIYRKMGISHHASLLLFLIKSNEALRLAYMKLFLPPHKILHSISMAGSLTYQQELKSRNQKT